MKNRSSSHIALIAGAVFTFDSPSDPPKVTRDAVHLLLAYELERQTVGGETVFVPVHWQLLSLETLEVESLSYSTTPPRCPERICLEASGWTHCRHRRRGGRVV